MKFDPYGCDVSNIVETWLKGEKKEKNEKKKKSNQNRCKNNDSVIIYCAVLKYETIARTYSSVGAGMLLVGVWQHIWQKSKKK